MRDRTETLPPEVQIDLQLISRSTLLQHHAKAATRTIRNLVACEGNQHPYTFYYIFDTTFELSIFAGQPV